MNLFRRTLVLGAASTAVAGMAAPALAKLAHRHAPRRGAHHGRHHAAAAPNDVQPAPASIIDASQTRRLNVRSLHTGETLDAVYYENGAYVPGVLAAAMEVLRDWRNGLEHFMEPRLFDTLHRLHASLEVNAPFQIISGFRSKQTNDMLHSRSKGVASNSQHTLGKAVDVRLEGVDLSRLHKAALALGAGGVGFYPVSDFVHVDVGPVRQWVGA